MEYNVDYNKYKPAKGRTTIHNLKNFMESSTAFSNGGTTFKVWSKVAIGFLVYLVSSAIVSALVGWFFGIFVWVIFFGLYVRLVSLIVFNERQVARDYKLRQESGDVINPDEVWGIYDVSDTHPYFISFVTGEVGLCVNFVKDSTVGNYADKSYNHYEAMTSMLRYAYNYGVSVTFLDVQSSEVRDTRLDDLYDNLDEVKNPVLEKVLASIYANLEDDSTDVRLSTETYIFRSSRGEADLWDNVQMIKRLALKGNYKGIYHCNADKIKDIVKGFYGIEDFAISEANSKVADRSGSTSIKVICLINKEGKKKWLHPEFKPKKEETQHTETEKTVIGVEVESNKRLDIFDSKTEFLGSDLDEYYGENIPGVSEQEEFFDEVKDTGIVEITGETDITDLFGDFGFSDSNKGVSDKGVSFEENPKPKAKQKIKRSSMERDVTSELRMLAEMPVTSNRKSTDVPVDERKLKAKKKKEAKSKKNKSVDLFS